MLKQKFLSLLNNRLSFFLLLIILLSLIMAHPLYSHELSDNDLPYFYALSKVDPVDAERIENLTKSARYGSRAVRLQAALLLSKAGLGLGFKDLIASPGSDVRYIT